MTHVKPLLAVVACATALSLSACSAISLASNSGTSAVDAVTLNNYTSTNMAAIQTDAARGHGEHVDTLASLYGLQPEAADRFKRQLKNRYDVVFNSANPQQKMRELANAAGS